MVFNFYINGKNNNFYKIFTMLQTFFHSKLFNIRNNSVKTFANVSFQVFNKGDHLNFK